MVLLSLICQLLADVVILPGWLIWIARLGTPCAAILMPFGVLSVEYVTASYGANANDLACLRGRVNPGSRDLGAEDPADPCRGSR
jgi:hypothetical protein